MMRLKLPLWATFFTLSVVIVLCGLGLWQLDRLAWKHDLLRQFEHLRAQDAATVVLGEEDFLKKQGFAKGTVRGAFLHRHEIILRAKLQDGNLGVHVLTPFVLEGPTAVAILVNRGWMPDYKDLQIDRPEGIVQISGVVRLPPEPNLFTPVNVPEKNVWYTVSPAMIEPQKIGIKRVLGPMIFYAQGKIEGSYPQPVEALPKLNNNHAQYAVFWFSMALALMGVFVIRFAGK